MNKLYFLILPLYTTLSLALSDIDQMKIRYMMHKIRSDSSLYVQDQAVLLCYGYLGLVSEEDPKSVEALQDAKELKALGELVATFPINRQDLADRAKKTVEEFKHRRKAND